jgi:hypothetical protein
MMQDQDNASETSNSRTEVGERTFGSMDAPRAVGNVGAFSSYLFSSETVRHNVLLDSCVRSHRARVEPEEI